MSKPIIHAVSSARRFGGTPEDYLAIHEFMDSSKCCMADNRHRALTHNSWFIKAVLPKVFGQQLTVTLEDGREKQVTVEDIGEQHVLEDFGGVIPTPQDYLGLMEYAGWLNNGRDGTPPSHAKIAARKKVTTIKFD
jgi:hypothetical protein